MLRRSKRTRIVVRSGVSAASATPRAADASDALRATAIVLRVARVALVVLFILDAPLVAPCLASFGTSGSFLGALGRFVGPIAMAAAAHDEDETFARAEAAEGALDFRHALALYEDLAAGDDPQAVRAAHRATYLRARSADDFAGLQALEEARRGARDAVRIDRLVTRAEELSPSVVRVEIWAFAAEAYANLGHPNEAAHLLDRVIDAPEADVALARKAARDRVALAIDRGDVHAARDVLARADQAARRLGLPPGARVDGKLEPDIARLARRRVLRASSIAAVVALVVAVGITFGRAAPWRREPRPRFVTKLAFVYGAYVAVGGAALASAYERGTAKPFVLLGGVLAILLVLARVWNVSGSARVGPRLARAGVCASAAIGAAFLVLDNVDPSYLDGMGL